MNREIKFRAWHNGMYENVLIDGQIWTANLREDLWHSGNIMQFTGLKDKNGVDIFEGDIVQCSYGKGEVFNILGSFMVRWIDDPEADIEFLGLNKKGRRAREDEELFEVIGNIYESPLSEG